MNTYLGLHARYYDVVYADKPYAEEARFVAEFLREGSLLDVACGTGRHAEAFAELGFEVTALDYNPELLELGRERAPQVRFVEADMTDLGLGERFDAVTCLFDSIGYPLTDDGVVAALAGLHRHLTPGGAAVVEFLHAPAMKAARSPVRVARYELPDGGELVRIAESRLDPDSLVMEVDYELIRLDGAGGYERSRERQSNRAFEVGEMERLVKAGGFDRVEFVPAYASGEIGEDTWHVLAVAT